MTRPFAFQTAGRIAFGPGVARELLTLAPAMGARVLLVTGATPLRQDWAREGLVRAGVAVEVLAQPGEPTLAEVEAAVRAARRDRIEAVVAIGGGAAIDMGKAVAALATGGEVRAHLEVVGEARPLHAPALPMIAIPTTAGTGAEVTRNAVIGVPEAGRKVSLRDRRLLPTEALVDPDLLVGLPRGVLAASGLDALTQLIEAYVSPAATPITDPLCRDAIPRALRALPRLLADGTSGEAAASFRADMGLASLFGGLALANAKLGAVHGLAGVIGGRTGAAHGAICGRLLPGVLAANLAAVPAASPAGLRLREVQDWVAAALGGTPGDAPARLAALADEGGLPDLAGLGLRRATAASIAEAAALSSSMAGNPVRLDPAVLARLVAP